MSRGGAVRATDSLIAAKLRLRRRSSRPLLARRALASGVAGARGLRREFRSGGRRHGGNRARRRDPLRLVGERRGSGGRLLEGRRESIRRRGGAVLGRSRGGLPLECLRREGFLLRERVGRGARRRRRERNRDAARGPLAFDERRAQDHGDERGRERARPAEIDPEHDAEGWPAAVGRLEPAQDARGEVRRGGRGAGRPVVRERRLEVGRGLSAVVAVGAVRLEVRLLGRGELSVMQPRQELERAGGMRDAAHRERLPAWRSGRRIAFNWPRPRAMRDLTVPTGTASETAISS